jgi:hypothetical protein
MYKTHFAHSLNIAQCVPFICVLGTVKPADFPHSDGDIAEISYSWQAVER